MWAADPVSFNFPSECTMNFDSAEWSTHIRYLEVVAGLQALQALRGDGQQDVDGMLQADHLVHSIPEPSVHPFTAHIEEVCIVKAASLRAVFAVQSTPN
jgi:hypothetical protein